MVEKDDYESDVKFGQWLKDLRQSTGATVEDAAKNSGLQLSRLKSLEIGYAEKGITRAEAEALSKLYKMNLEEFLKRASQD